MIFHADFSIAQTNNGWTIMYYAVGSNSSETDLLSDIDEMIQGKKSDGYELITLIDRIEGFSNDSSTLGENFTDTRLYKIDNNTFERLNGKEILPQIKIDESFEANMADASLLKSFIKYCKKYYPADHYMLVLRSHGNGVGMCPDAESGTMDRLYPSELSAVLTKEESVDILGLDVCSMAGLENLFEWRPSNNSFSADYVIASSPLSGAWAYDHILNRIQTKEGININPGSNHFGKGSERNLNPYQMTPIEFSKLIIEEIYDNQRWASWGLFDNTTIDSVKTKIDKLAKLLTFEKKSTIIKIIEETLGYHHNTNDNIELAQLTFPYIDAYHFYSLIAASSEIKMTSRYMAEEVCEAIDNFVVHSYYGEGFLPETTSFAEGKNGIYQIIPRGNKVFSQTGSTFWTHSSWFHPDDKTNDSNSYGLYDWCREGAIRENNKVDNFFEYLDYLFDDSNSKSGGVNNYQW